MKKGSGKRKGSAFERSIAILLSEWWTKDFDQPRDDLFWRTATSGGRASVRSQQGKTTVGHYGDLQATGEIGAALLRLVTIELKAGYFQSTLQDMLDGSRKSDWYEWMMQAKKQACEAGSLGWALIVRRTRRQPILALDADTYRALTHRSPSLKRVLPTVQVTWASESGDLEAAVVPLMSFLGSIDREDVLAVLAEKGVRGGQE